MLTTPCLNWDDAVDAHEQHQRAGNAGAGHRRDAVERSQEAVDEPGLSALLGDKPASQDSDEAERPHLRTAET